MKIVKLPGLIDPHVHFRTPGQKHKEDFSTGTAAAIAGGFTIVLDMPNNKIPITTKALLEEKTKLAKENIRCDIGFHFGSLGDNLEEFEKVAKKVMGLKLYLNETTGNFLIDKKALAKIFDAWPKKAGIILVHAEDDAVGAVIKESERTNKRAHFCHISLKSDLEQIIKAKKKKIKVTCGVTPHHLFLNKKDTEKLGPYGRMKPFLKERKDTEFFWKNLKWIDVIESDHAPHTKLEKESDSSPFGVPGLETTLPLLINAVHEGKLKISDIKRLCYSGPKKIFNLPLQNSSVEVDIDEEFIVDSKSLKTKCKWSPFVGRKLRGKIKKVKIRNKVVFKDGKILAEKGFGKIIKPDL